jgi:hypothetical protein
MQVMLVNNIDKRKPTRVKEKLHGTKTLTNELSEAERILIYLRRQLIRDRCVLLAIVSHFFVYWRNNHKAFR